MKRYVCRQVATSDVTSAIYMQIRMNYLFEQMRDSQNVLMHVMSNNMHLPGPLALVVCCEWMDVIIYAWVAGQA